MCNPVFFATDLENSFAISKFSLVVGPSFIFLKPQDFQKIKVKVKVKLFD